MSEHRVANAAQAALLLNVELRPLLNLLMERPCTAGEVAAALNLKLSRAHYLLTKLLRADVASIKSTQPRAGRALKRYAVLPRWFIPFEVSGADTLVDFGNAQMLPRVEQLVNNAVQIFLEHSRDRRGYWLEAQRLSMGDEHGPADDLFLGDEPFVLNLGMIRLSREHAAAFKQRLSAVMQEFEPFDTPGETPYGVGFMLVRGEVI